MPGVQNPGRLEFLTDLRRVQDPIYTLERMARYFQLTGKFAYQTMSKWERGEVTPAERKHRTRFLYYLWDELLLRRDHAQFEEVWQILVEEWQWHPLDEGERRTFRLSAIDERFVSTSTLVPIQVPSYTPHFVERRDETLEIIDWLAPSMLNQAATPSIKIAALVGMGGIGKTTLATHIAHQLQERFRDGILWARVATDNPLDILQSWAQAYNHDFSSISSAESRAAAVRNMLADKQVLIVLDDVSSLEQGQLLMPNASDCSVLITTRNQDIAVALNANCLVLDGLAEQQCIELLTRTIGESRVDSEQDAALEICKLLHCLPLAVELVAQRLRSRPRQKLAAMVTRLQIASYRLDLGISDRAVRASFLVSWDVLTPELRLLFALLGVFTGRTFGVEALAYVAMFDEITVEDYLMDLSALSLVNEDDERYQQHPLLADFAQEQLVEQQFTPENNPEQRLAEFYLALAHQNQPNYEDFDAHMDDIMFGMETAYRLQRWQLVLDYAENLTKPWLMRAEYSRARQGYQWAVEGAQTLQVTEPEAHFLYHWGTACLEQGSHDEASQLFMQCQQIAYHLEFDSVVADIHYKQATIEIEQSNYEEAEKLLSSCKNIRTTLGDDVGCAAVLYWQGLIAYRNENYSEAHTSCLEALHTQKQAQEDIGQLRTYRLITDILFELKQLEDALVNAKQALTLAKKAKNLGEYAAALFSLGKVYRARGDLEPAKQFLERSLILFEQMGSKSFYALSLFELSKVNYLKREFTVAIDCIQKSIVQMYLLQDISNLVLVLRTLGEMQMHMDDLDAAKQAWRDALMLAETHNHPQVAELEKRLSIN
ncbi:MAG: NB-ARC domain-containing protein [Chloroflexota bacterium]